MNECAPLYYSHEVYQWLSENYPGRLIRREQEVTVSRPACSPDFNHLDHCSDISEPISMSVQSILERNCGVELNNLQIK
jgi:hypothetical protein